MSSEKVFPVVGIGASAGGVEAFEGFFRGMPADTGMAFVLVTHMPPGHETTLPEILARYTDMPVTSIRHGEAIEPDHVYVCPSAHVVTIKDRLFSLTPREAGYDHKPIDLFLSSLAVAFTDDAVGVVLSGGGSDGALGIKAIKQHGGVALAQGSDGSGPRQSSMPEAAIATGAVDLVLPVEQMAARLAEFARSHRDDAATEPDDQAAGAAADSPDLRREIARLLQVQVGHDFSGYKEKSFMRRVRRRMHILQLPDLAAYVDRLRMEPEEVKLLFRDLLIGVTNFFRDQDAFDALKELVIPKLFEGVGAADSVRIWVPGCATGEEAYSIAILVREHMDSLKTVPTVQIFATDIDDAALTVARRGRYPHALIEHLDPARLARFFVRDDVSYAIVKELRDLCIFSLHSVLRDPPFSRIDLISCRNLLIYLGPEFQGRVVPIFHLALRPSGYLFLGTSESISQYSDLFQRIDKKQRLFQRRDHVSSPFRLSMSAPGTRATMVGTGIRREPVATAGSLRAAVESRVMEHFAPPHVVVNRDGDIVYYSSRTGRYLEAAAGMPSRQLLASARRGLRLDLRHAFQEALESRRPTVRDGVAVEIDDHIQTVRITVEPIGNHETDPLFLVLFTDVGRPQLPSEMAGLGSPGGDGTVEQLERELRDTRERLQVTVEEYEASLEEMKSGNEEMVSVNEELQSTNEELETSKEELQSVNEELQTVNSELNSKVEELDRANSDLRNLFESTQVGTIFLDRRLVIRSFTAAATSVFNLIATDRGRPLTDIVSHFAFDGFEREIRSVLEHGEMVERRVHRSDGTSHYLMRILPYHGRNNVTEGVVVTFFDVTKLVESEGQQRALVEELNHRVRNMLTVVTAIAQRALARSESPEEFIKSFTARIQGMAAAYNLISSAKWGDVPLRDVLEAAIEPYRGNGNHIELAGPEVLLKPKAVLALGLAAHELAANAAKYGALSSHAGDVSVGWRQDEGDGRTLSLRWREANGPAVKQPTKRGLGSELIERELKNMLRGSAKFNYAPAGLEVVLSIPIDPTIISVPS